MYSTRIFSKLCLFASLILLAIGLHMKYNNILSTGLPYRTRLGTDMDAETIDGNGAIFFGVLVLIVSLISHIVYIIQKKDRIKRKAEETGF